jgi:hypothetical protein
LRRKHGDKSAECSVAVEDHDGNNEDHDGNNEDHDGNNEDHDGNDTEHKDNDVSDYNQSNNVQ